ncbi:MAG: hypothetical protein C0408_02995 [Odoribacter sp.]|nr:hypothetical protein [Odoribacter sp.]MBA4369147.1 hypothetical protein [Desulfobacterium sp.]
MLSRLFKKLIFTVVLQPILLFGLFYSSGFSADAISWGRFLLSPQIAVEEQYSDNIFQEHKNTKKDNIVTVSPGLSSYLATTDNSRLGLHYKGDFSFYAKYDDLDGRDNEGKVDWSLTTPSDSTFEIGTKILDTAIQSDDKILNKAIQSDDKMLGKAIQPDDEDDTDQPYLLKTAYADTNLKPGEFTEIGFRYEYISREFDDRSGLAYDSDQDDYDRNLFRLDYVNKYFPRFPLLLDYRHTINNRNDLEGSAGDSRSNAIYVGARWTPETRLSGNLRIGYQKTEYEGEEDVNKLVTDTALTYRLTDVTNLQLKVNRSLEDSTRAENESGHNYTFTTWQGTIQYNYSEPLKLSFRLRYQNKKFDKTANREEDDIYKTRIGLEYALNQWVDLSLSYQYKQTVSDDETEEYKENSGFFGVRLSL